MLFYGKVEFFENKQKNVDFAKSFILVNIFYKSCKNFVTRLIKFGNKVFLKMLDQFARTSIEINENNKADKLINWVFY